LNAKVSLLLASAIYLLVAVELAFHATAYDRVAPFL
jgi:hypothetical protein